uniref:Uncharacterized protein n=1 Tax=Sphaerodactylus townsendi TaxID=933632 RepID=A0ACB8EU07_9SAUR
MSISAAHVITPADDVPAIWSGIGVVPKDAGYEKDLKIPTLSFGATMLTRLFSEPSLIPEVQKFSSWADDCDTDERSDKEECKPKACPLDDQNEGPWGSPRRRTT